MQLASRVVEADDIMSLQELYHSRGWTDGMPIVPPTREAVRACLEWALMPPDQLIGVEPVRGRPVTAEKIAVNAVMAGCPAELLRVVTTAVSALCRPELNLAGFQATTGPAAPVVIVHGEVVGKLGFNCSHGTFGPGWVANASVGRAVVAQG